MLDEVFHELQGEPLEVENSLESLQVWKMSDVVGPSRVICLHDIIVVAEECNERMSDRQEGPEDSLHLKNASERVIRRAREIHLHF